MHSTIRRCQSAGVLLGLLACAMCSAAELPALPAVSSAEREIGFGNAGALSSSTTELKASTLKAASTSTLQGAVIDWNSNLFARDALAGSGGPTSEAGILRSRVAFDLPASRPGETPSLAAHYASNRVGDGDELGAGWVLAVPALERHRDIEGVDTYYLRIGSDYTVLLAESEADALVLRPRGAPLSAVFRIAASGATADFGDGNTWRLGTTPDTAQVSDRTNTVSIWRVTQMSLWDRAYARWTYKHDAGATYLDAVSYQPAGGEGADAIVVRVGYEPRLTAVERYRDGNVVENRLRAATLTATADGVVTRQWRFTYSPVQTLVGIAAVDERLSRIDEVATHPATGLESTRRLASFQYITTADATQETWPAGSTPPQPASSLVADLNTDGRADIASVEERGAGWYVWLSEGNGWNDVEPTRRPWTPGPPGRVRVGLFGTTVYMPTPWAAVAGDFDGDGRTDLLHGLPYQAVGPGVWWMFRSTGTGWKTAPSSEHWREGPLSFSTLPMPPYYDLFSFMLRCRVGRFNADRRDDVACYADFSPKGPWTIGFSKGDSWHLAAIGDSTGSLGPGPRAASNADQKGAQWVKGCVAGDFTGEGLDDLVCRKNPTSLEWDVAQTDGEKWRMTSWRVVSGTPLSTCFVASVNGDELADLVCHAAKNQWYAIASTGSGWAAPRKLTGPDVATAEGKCSAVDLDADRVSEVVCVDRDPKTFLYASLRTDGPVARLTVVPGKQPLYDASCYVADFRGTGAPSFMCGTTSRRETRHATVSAPYAGLLSETTNAFGGSHRVTYQSSAEIRSQDDGGLSPAMPVVASIALLDGAEVVRTERYNYTGIVKNQKNAFVTFAEVTVDTLDASGTPMTTSIERRRRRHDDDRDDVLTGAVASRDIRSPGGCTLRSDQWDYALANVSGSKGRHAYVSRAMTREPASVDACADQRLVRNAVTYPSEYGVPSVRFEQHSLDGHSEDAVTRFEFLPPIRAGFEPRLHVASLLGGTIRCTRAADGGCVPGAAELAAASLQERGKRTLDYAASVGGTCKPTPGPWDQLYPSVVVDGIRKQRYVYGPQGRTQCASQTEGAWDVFEWDPEGIAVVAHTSPDGVRSAHHISGIGAALTEPRGSVVRLVERPGVSTDFAYDGLGRITRVSPLGGLSIDLEVEEADGNRRRALRARLADGTRVLQRWNGFGGIVEHEQSSDAGRHIVVNAYDYAGRIARTTLPSPADPQRTVTWTRERDALGRVTRTCGALGYCQTARHSAYAIDLRDGQGEDKHLRLNAFGGVAELWSGKPLALRASATFDASGHLREMRDADTRTLAVERTYGAVTRVSRPGVPDTTLTYDGTGALSAVTQGARTATYGHDEIGRLVRVGMRQGAKASLQVEYNFVRSGRDIGQLRSVRTPEVEETYAYDDQLRPASIKQSVTGSGGTLELGYEYDELGRLWRVRTGAQAGIEYRYSGGELAAAARIGDNDHPLFEASDFHPLMGPRDVAVGTARLSRTFDGLGRVETQRLSGQSVAYGYDLSGNVTSLDLGDLKLSLGHDDVGRLTRIVGGDIDRAYAFNQADSPTQVGDTWLTYDNPSAPHAATSAAASAITRDEHGRITQWGRVGLRYDAADDVPSRVIFPGAFNDLEITRGPSGELVRVTRGMRTLYRALGRLQCRDGACAYAMTPGAGIEVEVPTAGGSPRVAMSGPGGATSLSISGSAHPTSTVRDGYGVPLTGRDTVRIGDPVAGNGVVLSTDPALSLVGDRVLWGELGNFVSSDDLVPNDMGQAPFNGFAFARNNGLRFTDVGGRYGYDPSSTGAGAMSFRLNFPMPVFSFSFNFDYGLQSDMDGRVLHDQWADLNRTLFRLYERNEANFMAKGGAPMSLAFPGGLFGQDASGVPRGASIGAGFIERNVEAASDAWAPPVAFANNVWPDHAWDYKSRAPSMIRSPGEWLVAQNAGNFNYGAVGVAVGFSPATLLQFAGAVQMGQSISQLRGQYLLRLLLGQYGVPFAKPPYGDDFVDQYWINRGIQYFQAHGRRESP